MKCILVLDDNSEIREAASSKLQNHLKDCSVVTGSNGAEGEAILRSTPVDLILTDLAMPVMNGYALIQRARKDFPSVPICVMTANCSPSVIKRLRAVGVGSWIEKPFKFEELVRMVARELNLAYND